MNTEEINVDMKDASGDAEPKVEATDPLQVAADADATEADVSEADLDQEEQEKQPMTGGVAADAPSASEDEVTVSAAEKNGSVKLKIPDDDDAQEVTFTGLNKEELLRVAGTPGWVRIRRVLLAVFWMGWLGMLVGAVLIIIQAPRCRDLPPTNWWNDGPLYQVGDVKAFSEDLKGLEQKLDSMSQLKVKGLVIGPIHNDPRDDAINLNYQEISSDVGTLEQFKSFIQTAHKKGISVVLDMTPNYQGSSGPWFANSSVSTVENILRPALMFWLEKGVDGVQLSGVEHVASVMPTLWSDIRAIVQNYTDERSSSRVLIGVTDRASAEDVSSLLSSTNVNLLISKDLLSSSADATERAQSIQHLYSSHNQRKLAWSLEERAQDPTLVKLNQLLLMTLPGTPVFKYGDEIGLKDEGNKFPKMLWDTDEELNGTQQEERAERLSCRHFFRALSELRNKERSLLFGDFVLLSNSSSSLAYLRVWDQSERYLAAFNWAEEEETLLMLPPSNVVLPRHATVALSTDSGALPKDSSVDLINLKLGPGQAALLRFPYTG